MASLGEFLALAVSLEDLGIKTGNARARILARTLDAATGTLLDNSKNPSRKTGELDNRGSQFYLAMYWAQELAAQGEDKELAEHFAALATALAAVLVVVLNLVFPLFAGHPLTEATTAWGALRIVPCFALGCAVYLLWRNKAVTSPVGAKAITGVKHRWHEVRGHFRTKYNADGSIKWRIPIKPHERGDERLGKITKTYKVER